mmetsp:Transcript_16389/g.27547  ORF Transcript_16389/g.27547 Transcript_16389/m.27547 type:complete len:440 (-) Transcript_16389:93-1412(-)
MHVEEGAQLVADAVELPRLVPALRLDGVGVHGVALPHHNLAGFLHRLDQLREVHSQLLGAHAHNDHDLASSVLGVDRLDELDELAGVALVADLDADGVFDAAHVLDVCAVQLAGALADPQQVRRAAVPLVRCAVHAGESLLVVQQERLVAGEELGAFRDRVVLLNAARSHEKYRLIQLLGEVQELLALLAVLLHEIKVPLLDALQGSVATHGKPAQQVKCRSGLVVRPDQAGGVGRARRGGERVAVDVVTAVARELHPVDCLRVRRPWLRELTSHASDLDDGHTSSVHQYGTHLQDNAEGIANVIRLELREALGAVAALQHEAVAHRHLRQLGPQVACLAREHKRRVALDLLQHGLQVLLARPIGLLLRLIFRPGTRAPLATLHIGSLLGDFHHTLRGAGHGERPAAGWHHARAKHGAVLRARRQRIALGGKTTSNHGG